MDTLWTLLWIFFMVIFFMIFFMVVMDLFSDHEMSGWGKAIWIIFLILFPPITVLVYLIARGGSMAKRRQAQIEAAQAAQASYIKEVAGTGSAADQITQAQNLLQQGAITQAEFDQLKAKALAS